MAELPARWAPAARTSPSDHSRRWSRTCCALLAAVVSGIAIATPASLPAQVGDGRNSGYVVPGPLAASGAMGNPQRTYPKGTYYFPFAPYYDGQYANAVEGFQDSLRGSRKVPGPWLDSICHHAMLGECYYQLGRLNEALTEYTAALQITLAYPNWLRRVQFAAEIRPVGTGRYTSTPWGQSRRNATLGRFPAGNVWQEGEVFNTEPVTRGGVVTPAQILSINPYEIVRGTCLAIRRRTELMGQLGASDPLNQQIIGMYLESGRADWPRFLIDVPLGLAYRAAGKEPQAQGVLERSLTTEGYDHPFTGMVLLELGQLASNSGNAAAAAEYFEEATYAAAQYDDADTIEAAIQELLGLERLLNGQRDFPRLAAAADWAGSRELRKLRVALLLAAAEREAQAGRTADAARITNQADQLVGRRDLRAARGGARLHWIRSLVNYQQNKVIDGDKMLQLAVGFQRRGSPRQFQLHLLSRQLTGEDISARNALEIYGKLLREPTAADWLRDPLDALTAWWTPQAAAFEQWFLTAWNRQRGEELALLFEIADLARRHQFLSSLELGGRPQAFDWLLSTPPEQLDQELQLQRQDLLVRFPEYARLKQLADPLRAELAQLGAGAEIEMRRTHAELLERAATQVAARRRALRELSVRREPAGIAFPPIRTATEAQQALPDRHAILAFFTAQAKTFGFLVTNQKYEVWEVGSEERLRDDVVALLKAWNHINSHRALSPTEATDTGWKQQAAVLLRVLVAGAETDFPTNASLDEITIVPDGALWYLPFETLQYGPSGKTHPLIAAARLRYTPTAGLAVDRRKPMAPIDQTTVILGKLSPREDDVSMTATLRELEKAAPGTVGWRRPLSEAATLAATTSGRLIVLDILPLDGKAPYDWSPLGVDRGDQESTLADWLTLPWPVPREVLLPGFHTAAEFSLKSGSITANGQELFLSTMALASAGARTVVLSRWRTGGATTRDELREFVQELPFTSPAEAWQRSQLLCMRNPLNPANEPRLNWKSRDPPPRAEHPFFWAAPLLMDCGVFDQEALQLDPAEPQVARDPAH